jgi:hypothetical protein
LGLDGFLFWAANGYRGANEYETSLGPFPSFANGGSRYPGHPPGDNWFYYRSPEGLRPSIRIVSFREGLFDYALLTMLAQRDPDMAKKLVAEDRTVDQQILSVTPMIYHQTRTTILEALDNRGSASKESVRWTTRLWSGPPVPSDVTKIPFAPGLEHRTIHRPGDSDDKFLHGAAIIHHEGVMYANWANSPDQRERAARDASGQAFEGRRQDVVGPRGRRAGL